MSAKLSSNNYNDHLNKLLTDKEKEVFKGTVIIREMNNNGNITGLEHGLFVNGKKYLQSLHQILDIFWETHKLLSHQESTACRYV